MKQLTIYLGSHCNLDCAYCHRIADKEEPKISKNLIESIRGKDNILIKFMGGEPTLYMDEIRKVVAAAPKANYAIGTNGVNLDRYLDFFRRHDFLICISYDGKTNSPRGFDPFTKLVDYPKLAVSTTIYRGNTNLKGIIKNFAEKERIIGRPLSFFPHIAHHTCAENEAFALTKDDADSYVSQYQELVGNYMRERFQYGIKNIRYEGMFQALIKRLEHPFSFGETYCVNSRVKKCDALGNLYTCLYIRDENLNYSDWQQQQGQLLSKQWGQCKCCQVYDMCGGACIKSLSHDIECGIYYRLYTWFKEAYPKWKEAL
jgi:uncharacterized protein